MAERAVFGESRAAVTREDETERGLPFRLLFRVRYGECDAQNIVFNARWGDYVDIASTEYMRSLFGKLLSLNVATKGLRIEALGLRNAWRFSFDRANNDLYLGDVGQGAVEEIDWTPANSPGLENYGWDVYEGRSKYEDKPLGPGKLMQPVAQYTHSNGCSVTGGYVYRGSNASLRGRYIYGDYCSGLVWSFKLAGGKATGLRRESFRVASLTSFGQDTAGELYAVSHGGTIYRLTP